MQELIVSKTHESMVHNPDLMAESNWAYLASMEVATDIHEDVNLFGAQTQTSASNIFSNQLERKQSIQASGKGGPRGTQAEKSGKESSANKDAMERLQGIIDPEDPRFDKLKTESIAVWQKRVNELCDSMNMGVDRFYVRKTNTYNQICNSNNFCREEFCPTANLKELTPCQVKNAQKPWNFSSLPGLNLKDSSSLGENPEHLAKLSQKLLDFEKLGFWHEPIELSESLETFFSDVRHLLLTKAKQLSEGEPASFTDGGPENDSTTLESAAEMLGNAISCIFGLAVLSGNFEIIIQALETIHTFEKAATSASLRDAVFSKCSDQLKHYLNQIEQAARESQSFHAMLGANLSAVFGIGKQFHNSRLTNRNVALTTDGEHLYLCMSQSQSGNMFKIGTGERGTVAGRVTLSVPIEKEGDLSWVYCQGRLYARRNNADFGSLLVYDPKSFKKLGEARLLCDDLFRGNKALKAANSNYPLLTDGESLFALLMTVERREQTLKAGLEEQHQKLKDAKKEKEAAKTLDKQNSTVSYDASEALKAVAAAARENDWSSSQLKEQVMKKMRNSKGGKKVGRAETKEEALKKAEMKASPQRELQNYYMAVFTLHKFDVSGGQKALEAQELEQKTEHELYQIPIVQEMKHAFADFFSVRDCAKALKLHDDDIEEAAAWLCEQGENPSVKWHIPRVGITPICESLVSGKWSESGQQPPSAKALAASYYTSSKQAHGSEAEILTSRHSVLHASCIEPGKWTMSRQGQLTYHSVDSKGETGVAYVFSTDKRDFKALDANPDELDKLNKHHRESQAALFQADGDTLHWYWDGDKWLSFTRQSLAENAHLVAEMAAKDKLRATDPEKADQFAFVSEWDLYSGVTTKSSLLRVIEDRDSLNLKTVNYLTYDPKTSKFLAITLEQPVRNVVVYDDPTQLMPRAADPQQLDEVSSMAQFLQVSLRSLLHANSLRFQMPWRWSRWAHTYHQVTEFLERGRSHLRDPSREPEEPEDKSKVQASLKKLHKRLDYARERELALELARLGLELCPPEQAQIYRNQKKKQLVTDQKAEEKRKAKAEKVQEQASHTKSSMAFDYKQAFAKPATASKQFPDMVDAKSFLAQYGIRDAFDEGSKDRKSKPSSSVFKKASPVDGPVPRELMEAMLFDEKGGLSSDEDWGAFQVNEAAMMEFFNPAKYEADSLERVAKAQKKKKIHVSARGGRGGFIGGRGGQRGGSQAAYNQFEFVEDRPAQFSHSKEPISAAGLFGSSTKSKAALFDSRPFVPSTPSLEAFVLPWEQICVPVETKKVFAFSANGTPKAIQTLLAFLRESNDNEPLFQLLLQCMSFSDQLLAYQHPELCDELCDFLKQLVSAEEGAASESIKQIVWRVLVVGWFKFARNATAALELLSLFVAHSKQPKTAVAREDKQSASEQQTHVERHYSYYEKLFGTEQSASDAALRPLEIFHLRFYAYPQSFYFFEAIQQSKVEGYKVMLQSKDLLDPVLFKRSASSSLAAVTQPSLQPDESEQGEDEQPAREPFVASFRHKFRTHLLSKSRSCFKNVQRVVSSLSEVPPESIYLQPLPSSGGPWNDRLSQFSITDQYFAMPLYQLFNEEMIDFDKPELPKDDLEFLCERYSSDPAELDATSSKQERQVALHKHLMMLREANVVQREKVMQQFMDAILQSLNDQSEVQSDSAYFWHDGTSFAMIDTFKRLVESGMAIVDIKNPLQLTTLQTILRFIDDCMATLSKKTNGFRENPMRKHHVRWLEHFRGFISAVIWQLNLVLGSQMRNQIAYSTLPTLISILETLKKLFNSYPSDDKAKQGQLLQPSLNILEHLSTTNNEGVDPANVQTFETAHPYPLNDQQRKFFTVPRAIGYLIEIDPRSSISSHSCQLTIRSPHDYSQSLNDDFSTYFEFRRGLASLKSHQFFVFGQTVMVDWSSTAPRRRPNEDDSGQRWGVKLTVKPLLGSPGYLSKQSLPHDTIRSIFGRINNDLYSWFQLMNLMVFICAAFSQELTDGNLIHYQTEGAMATGTGVFNLLNKGKSGDSISEYSMSIATKSQVGGPLSQLYQAAGYTQPSSQRAKKDMSMSNILKSDVLNWYLFKSGLKVPQVDKMSHEKALQEGLTLINEGLIKNQEQIFDSLKTLPEKPEVANSAEQALQHDKTSRQTMLKSQVTSKKNFNPRKEVWSPDVIEFFDKAASDSSSLGDQVLSKIRLLCPEPVFMNQIFLRVTNKPFRQTWNEVQVNLIGAMLYHSDSMQDARKFLAIDDQVCLDFKSKKVVDAQLNTEQSQLLEQFSLIGRQLNLVLLHMVNRLDGQKRYIDCIRDTIEISQKLLDQAVSDKKELLEKQRIEREEKARQMKEISLMAQADLEMRMFMAAEKAEQERKKQEATQLEEKKDATGKAAEANKAATDAKKPSAAPKVKSHDPMKSKGRANRARGIAMPKVVPKAQKKPKPVASKSIEEAKEEVKEESKAGGAAKEDKADAEKPQNAELAKPTENTSSTVQINTKEGRKDAEQPDNEADEEEGETIVLANLSTEELSSLKSKISSEAFKRMSDDLLDSNRLITLSAFFGIEFSVEDPHNTLKKIFKQVKENIRVLIDLDEDAVPVPEKIDLSSIELGTPIEEVARDVQKRVLFLFEVIPSTNYQAEVTKIVTKPAKQAYFRNKRMVDIIEEIEEDQLSQVIQSSVARGATEQSVVSQIDDEEGEMLSDSDSEELLPEAPKRSYSVPVQTTQAAFMNLSAGKAAGGQQDQSDEKLQLKRKQSMEYSDWVEGYRKWRLWNKKGFLEEDLHTAYGSPLQAVVSFAKCSEVNNLIKLRNIMLDHKYVGHFRLFGLQQQAKLFAMFSKTIFSRFIIGGQACMLRESVLNHVETCGEQITKQLNSCSRHLVQHLMNIVVTQVNDELSTNVKKSASQTTASRQTTQPSSDSVQKTESKNGQRASACAAPADVAGQKQASAMADTTRHSKRHQSKQAQTEEIIYIDDLRRMLHSMNDIRVLLNNVFTKEYILESLQQDKKIQTKDTLGTDQIRAFLRALIHLIISSSCPESLLSHFEGSKSISSILTLKQSLAEVAKIVLNQFMKDGKEMVAQSETQRILQEMLLDIIVAQLEQKCYVTAADSQGDEAQQNRESSRMVECIELLKMLAEMIQVNLDEKKQDHQQQQPQQQKTQVQDADSAAQENGVATSQQAAVSQLYVGGKQATRCASLLAFMLLRIEVPAVVRLAAKCAKVFFKLVDLQKINLYQDSESENSKKVVLDTGKNQTASVALENTQVVNMEQIDFLEEAFKIIGAKITGASTSTAKQDSLQTVPVVPAEESKVETPEVEKSAFAEDDMEETKASESGVTEQEVKEQGPDSNEQRVVDSNDGTERKYFVFANLNIPHEEDFTFLVTALWHWYQKYSHPALQLVKDPAEITQEPPATIVKSKTTKVEASQQPKFIQDATHKIKQLLLQSQQEVAAAALQSSSLAASLASRIEEEKKANDPSADGQAAAANAALQAEEEKKADVEEEKDKDSVDVNHQIIDALESQLKGNVEQRLKEVQDAEMQLADIQMKERNKQIVQTAAKKEISRQVLELFGNVFKDLDDNGNLRKLVERQTQKSKSADWAKSGQNLSQAYQLSRQKRPQDVRPATAASAVSLKIDALRHLLDGIVKVTFVNPLTTDSDELKKRRMNEKNYNLLLRKVIEEAVAIAVNLYSNNTCKVAGPYSEEKALELSSLIEMAYKGKLDPVQINPYMDKDKVNNKVTPTAKMTVAQIFPITSAKVRKFMTSERQRTPAKSILVAPKKLVVSMIEEATSTTLVRVFEQRTKEVKEETKGSTYGRVTQNEKPSVARSWRARSGSSCSLIIQELIQLVRSVVEENDLAKRKGSSSASQQAAAYRESDTVSRASTQKFRSHVVSALNKVLKELHQRSWETEMSLSERQRILGLLAVIGGWQASIRFGQAVQVSTNNQWSNAIVVDDGVGKQKLSVIYEDDEKLEIVQVPQQLVRAHQRYQIDITGDFGSAIDRDSLFQAISSLYRQSMQSMSQVNKALEKRSLEEEMSESLLSPEYLLVQLLRLASQLSQASTNLQDEVVKALFTNLQSIQDNDLLLDCATEGKSLSFWENEIAKSWQNLIEKTQSNSSSFYTPRDYPVSIQSDINKFASSENQMIQEMFRKAQSSLSGFQDAVNDSNYVQMKSTYLQGLPELDYKSTVHEKKLKLLQYWERNIIPRALEHMIRYIPEYKDPGMQQFVLGQIRGRLLQDQIAAAVSDIETMFQQDSVTLPIPDPSHDWGAKIIDECLVDSWALAVIHKDKKKASSSAENDKDADKQDGGQKKKIATGAVPDLGHPLLNKMASLGIRELLVQIKAVNGKNNQILTEFHDADSMTTHWIWFPIANLKSLIKPLGPRPNGFLTSTLRKQFEQTIRGSIVMFARQTILQFFQGMQGTSSLYRTMHSEAILLHQVISWGVLESFSEDPVTGWMREFTQAIPIERNGRGEHVRTKEERKFADHQAALRFVSQMLDKKQESITLSQLAAETKAANVKSVESDDASDSLSQIKNVFKRLARSLEDPETPEIEFEESKSVFTKIVDWCICNWYGLSARVAEERVVLDIYQEVQNLGDKRQQDAEQQQDHVLPIHELLPKKGQDSISTVIVFKKGGTCITPMSKIQFFSDSNQTNLVKELMAGKDIEMELAPIVLNENKIWTSIIEGSQELIPMHEQQSVKPKLECAIYQIPKEWTVVCWLTEVVTSSLISQDVDKSAHFCLETISKLVEVMQSFYEEAKAPAILKSAILQILSRLVIKIRFIYSCMGAKGRKLPEQIENQSHFERIFISADFVQTLLSQVAVCTEQEKHSFKNMQRAMSLKNKSQVLYSAFIQDAVEFLMLIMVPTERKTPIESQVDLLPKKEDKLTPSFTMPEWFDPLLKVSHFLHFFRDEMCLPAELMREIHSSSMESHLTNSTMDNIIVVRKIPKPSVDGAKDEQMYTSSWVMTRLFELLRHHQAVVLDHERDVQVIDDEDEPGSFMTIVLFIDGFSHLRELDHEPDEDDDDSKMLKLLHSETDDEGEGDEGGDKAKIEEEKSQSAKEAGPTVWNCPICTFENPVSTPTCAICEQGQRPSMQELIDQKNAADMIAKQEARAAKELENQGVKKEPLHHIRLKLLARDIRHMISHDQRQQLLKKLEEEKARKLKEAEEMRQAEEKIQKAKEESKKKQAQAAQQEPVGLIMIEEEEEEKKLVIEEEEEKKFMPIAAAFDGLHDEDWVDEDDDGGSESCKSDLTIDKIQNVVIRKRKRLNRRDSGPFDSDSSDGGSGGSDDSIDFDNLPEDRVERFELLGIDPSILDCGEEEIIMITEASKIEDMMRKQDQRRREKQERKNQKKLEEAARQAALIKEATNNLLSQTDTKLIKLEVTVTEEKIFGDDDTSNRIVQDVLRNRVKSEQDTDDFEFSAQTEQIIKEIHERFQTLPLDQLTLPENEPLLDEFGLTKQMIKEDELEEFMQKLQIVIVADTRLFFKLILSQGYDLHLTRAVLPTYDFNYCGGVVDKLSRNVPLLRQVKTLIEKHYCRDKQIVTQLTPSMIRIVSLLPDWKDKTAADDDDDEDKADGEKEQQRNIDAKTGVNLAKLVRSTQVRFESETSIMQGYPEVRSLLNQETVRHCWSLLQSFNKHFAEVVPFVNQPEYLAEMPKNSAIPMSIAAYMSQAKSLGLSSTKTDLKFLILDQTSLEIEQPPTLYFERLRMAEAMDKKAAQAAGADASDDEVEQNVRSKQGKKDHAFMFLQAYEQIKDMNLAQFRPIKPVSSEPHLAFKIKFENEKVQGDGGPYRQFFEDVSMELQPSKLEQNISTRLLSLLMPCANQLDNEQDGKDKFMLNSERTSASDLNLFYFLGVLMGVCIRTGAKMILDLPRMVWKQLVGQRINLDDIAEVEARFVKMASQLLLTSETDYEHDPLQWEVKMSDGKTIDLRDDIDVCGEAEQVASGEVGTQRSLDVAYADRFKWIEKSLKARLMQSQAQCKAIRRGISEIVPQAFLNIGTHEELETWVCGRREVDIELLKRHAHYGGNDPDYGPDTALIKMFWQFLAEITEDERQRFIKFCWGQQRLPANDEAFNQENVRFMIKPLRSDKKQDHLLPTSDTCFFNLGLPRYSSLEVMKKKILLAINMDCVSMNAEEVIQENAGRRGDHSESFEY